MPDLFDQIDTKNEPAKDIFDELGSDSQADEDYAIRQRNRLTSLPTDWRDTAANLFNRGVGAAAETLQDTGSAAKNLAEAVPFLATGQTDLAKRQAEQAATDILSIPGEGQVLKSLGFQPVASEEPTPYEEGQQLQSRFGRIASGVVPSLIQSAPQMAAMAAGSAVGIPPSVTAPAVFGLTPEGFDIKQAAIAAALPFVGKYSGQLTEALASKLHVSNDAALNVLNKLGGTAGAAGYLGLIDESEIESLPKEKRDEARIDAVANLMGQSWLGMTASERGETPAAKPATRGQENAIPIRSTEAVPVVATPGDRGEVGARAPEPKTPAEAQKEVAGKEPRPRVAAPPVAAGNQTRDALTPALLVDGKPVTGGVTHQQIMQRLQSTPQAKAALTAFADDKNHVFVDAAGNVLDREQAAKVFDQLKGNSPGTTKALQSEMLAGQSAPATSETVESVTPLEPETGSPIQPTVTPSKRTVRSDAKAFDDLVKEHALAADWTRDPDALYSAPASSENQGTIGIKGKIAQNKAMQAARKQAAKDIGLDPAKIGDMAYRAEALKALQDHVAKHSPDWYKTEATAETNPELVGMGGAVSAEFGKPGSHVSNMFAVIDQSRKEMGLPPMERGQPRTWEQDAATALGKMNQEPGWIPSMIAQLKDKSRPLLSWENAGLVFHRQYLKAQFDNAIADISKAHEDAEQLTGDAQAKRLADKQQAQLDAARFEDEINALDQVTGKGGTGSEAGRTLQAQKMGAGDDFSLIEMRLAKRAAENDGAPLTPEQETEVQQTFEERKKAAQEYEDYLTDSQKRLAEQGMQEALTDAKAQAANAPSPYILSIADKIGARLKTSADAARERIKVRYAEGFKFGSGPLHEIPNIKDFAIIGAEHIYSAGLDFAKWSERMIGEFTEGIKPHLPAIFKESQKVVDATADEMTGKADKKTVRRAVKNGSPAEQQMAITDSIKDRFQKGETGGINGQVRKLMKLFAAQGVKSLDAMADLVESILKEAKPDITRQQTLAAMGGYGDYKAPASDEISATVTDLHNQAQLTSKLIDMQAGEPPKRSGVGRLPPTDEQRRLTKQVQDAQRRGGFKVTDPQTQLRTALQAIKTRLENQISDLRQEISTKTKIVRQKAATPTSPEIEGLRARLATVREEHRKVFGDRQLTAEQRIKQAMSAVQSQIDDYERRIQEKDFTTAGVKTPETPELRALRARRDAVRDQFAELRDLDTEFQAKTAEARERSALQAFKTRTTNRIADLEERMARGDYTPRPKRELKLDAEGLKKKADLEAVNLRWRRSLAADQAKKRSIPVKVADFVARWSRNVGALTFPTTIAKLTAAANLGALASTAEEAAGTATRFLAPKAIREGAPRFGGGLSLSREVDAYAKTFTNLVKDFKGAAKAGQTEIDLAHGKPEIRPENLSDWIGNLHYALKTPLMRNEWSRSVKVFMQYYAERGVDVSDPAVQQRIGNEAYRHAEERLLMSDNLAVKGYNAILRTLEAKSKVTGRTTMTGKAVATALRYELPIVKIPTNFARQVLEYSFGHFEAAGRVLRGTLAKDLGATIGERLENMPEQEKDLVLRNLRRGSVGTAMLLLGFFNPQAIGGYYQPGQHPKKDQVKPGEGRVFGLTVPRYAFDNPLMMNMQLGATIRHVSDKQLGKGTSWLAAHGTGLYAALVGVADETPFMREIQQFARDLPSFTRTAGGAGQRAIPGAVRWTAEQMDKDANGNIIPRKATNAAQMIELGIPGLRKTVPVDEKKYQSILAE